jgi:ribosome-associated protein
MKPKNAASIELVKLCFKVLDDKKAEDIRVLDVSEQSSITDFLLVATATSTPHLRALRVELEKVIDASKNRILGMDVAEESGWTVIDAFDVMVHLFLADRRKHYALENLWKDALEVSSTRLVETPAPVARAAKPRTKRSKAAVSRKRAPRTRDA